MHRIRRLVGGEAGPTAHFRPVHSLGALVVLASMGATAFGFAHWTEPAGPHDCQCCCHHPKKQQVDLTWTEAGPKAWAVIETEGGPWVADVTSEGELRIGEEIIAYELKSDAPDTFFLRREVAGQGDTFYVKPGEVAPEDSFIQEGEDTGAEGSRENVYVERILLDTGQTIVTRPDTFTYEVRKTATAPQPAPKVERVLYLSPRTMRGFLYEDAGAEMAPEADEPATEGHEVQDWIFRTRAVAPRGEEYKLDYTYESPPVEDYTLESGSAGEYSTLRVNVPFVQLETTPETEGPAPKAWLKLETVFEAESGELEVRPLLIQAEDGVRIQVSKPEKQVRLRYTPRYRRLHVNPTVEYTELRKIEDGPQ